MAFIRNGQGDLKCVFITEAELIDRFVGNQLWSWGCGGVAQLGTNSTISQSSPVQTVSTGTNWKQVSLGTSQSAAIKTDGTLWLWGIGTYGRLGNNSTINQSSPVQTVSTGTNWKQVDSGRYHSASIKTDGTLWLWGNGVNGRLGTNSTTYQSSPVQTVSTGTNWIQVDLGGSHSSSIKTDGTLWLWGIGTFGRLGINSTIDQSSPVQTVSTGTNWKQVSLGGYNSAAVKTDGTLWLWGCNGSGQMTQIPNITQTNFTDLGNQLVEKDYLIDVYPNLVPWMKTPGLFLWGYGTNGVLGTNSTTSQSSPVQTVSSGTNWKQVSMSSARYGEGAAAIKTDGTLWLWGFGCAGRLGTNSTINQSSPVQTVSTGTNWKQVAEGSIHSAAIKTDGTLWLWGCSRRGTLGNGDVRYDFYGATHRSSPVQTVSTGTNWKQVSLGGYNSAAVKTDGTLWLWGDGSYGQIGNNSLPYTVSSPVQTVSTGTNWKQVALGNDRQFPFSAAVKTDGTLWLWGRGDCGQLGNNLSGGTAHRSSPVQTVSTGTNWKQVSLGAKHSASIKTDGTLWLWGSKYGQGRGDLFNSCHQSSPVQTVSTGTNWKQVSLGTSASAAIKTDGSLWIWGSICTGNNVGLAYTPVQSGSDTGWKQVSIRGYNANRIGIIKEIEDW